MSGDRTLPPSGHVYRREGARGAVWYAKYRLGDGRQVQRRIGPAWTSRGRPPAGYFTEQSASRWLSEVISQARAGELSGMVRTGATFAEAVAEYLRWLEHDRARKPSTLRDYRSICESAPPPGLRDDAPRGPHDRGGRALVDEPRGGREHEQPHAPEDPHHPPRRDGARSPRVEAATEPRRATSRDPFCDRRPRSRSSPPEEVFALVRAAASEQDAGDLS